MSRPTPEPPAVAGRSPDPPAATSTHPPRIDRLPRSTNRTALPRAHPARIAKAPRRQPGSSYDVLVDREVWSSFTHDPRDARFASIRASDRDRSVVQQELDEAYADGRLDRDEYDERSERARQVRFLGDLNPILNDLV